MLHGGFEGTKTVITYKPISTSRYMAGSVGGKVVALDNNEVCYVTNAAKEKQEQGGTKGGGGTQQPKRGGTKKRGRRRRLSRRGSS